MSTKYPEHEKLQAVVDKSQAIGTFIEWLQDVKKLHLAKWTDIEHEDIVTDEIHIVQELCLEPLDINKTLAEYFEIDLNKLEQEKRDMLEELRKANARP